MSKEEYAKQFNALIELSELNEAEAVLLILELASIPLQSYIYKHDTVSGSIFINEYNVLFSKIKEYISQEELRHLKDAIENQGDNKSE